MSDARSKSQPHTLGLLDRYSDLVRWARQSTRGDDAVADDLPHEAYLALRDGVDEREVRNVNGSCSEPSATSTACGSGRSLVRYADEAHGIVQGEREDDMWTRTLAWYEEFLTIRP